MESEIEDEADIDDPEITFNTSKTKETPQTLHEEKSKRGRKRPYRECSNAEESHKSVKKLNSSEKPQKLTGLLESIKKNFLSSDKLSQGKASESFESEDEDALCPFECGICSHKFSTVENLEAHVTKEHNDNNSEKPEKEESTPKANNKAREISSDVIDEVADEFADEVAAFEAAEEKMQKQMEAKRAKFEEKKNANKVMMVTMVKKTGKVVVGGKRPSERNWQECPARNWAAEFGYGGVAPEVTYNISGNDSLKNESKHILMGTNSGATEKKATGRKKGAQPPPLQGNDLLSKMRATFRKDDEDDEENDDFGKNESDAMFRSRGLKGTIKASPGKAPRTLSSSSLRTRQRMEALMKRAREFMKQNRKEQMKTKKQKRGSKEDLADKKYVNKPSPNNIKRNSNRKPVQSVSEIKSKISNRSGLQKNIESKTLPKDGKVIAKQTEISSVVENVNAGVQRKSPRTSSNTVMEGQMTSKNDKKVGTTKPLPNRSIRQTRAQRKNEKDPHHQEKDESAQLNTSDNNATENLDMQAKRVDSKSGNDENNEKSENSKAGGNTRAKTPMGLFEKMQRNFANDLLNENEKILDEENESEKLDENVQDQDKDATPEINSSLDSGQIDKAPVNAIIENPQIQNGDDLPNNPSSIEEQETIASEDIGSQPSISTAEQEEEENVDDDSDEDDDSDIDMDGLLIPLENGWVCEKRLLGEEERKQRLQELEQQKRRRGRSAEDDEFAAMR